MTDFAERVARLAELSDDELISLESEIVAAFDAADESSDIDQMQDLADMLDQVRAEMSARDDGGNGEAADTAQTEMAASGASEETEDPAPEASAEETPEPTGETTTDTQPTSEGDGDGEETEETEGDKPEESEDTEPEATEEGKTETTEETEGDEPKAETEDNTDPQAEPADKESEQVATEITSEDVPEENAPVAASTAPVSIRAGGDIPGITAGSELDDMDSVVEAMTRKVNAMKGVSGNGEQLIVASIQHPDGDEDHTLRAGDLEGNSRKIRALISDPDQLTPEALTAGGWCAPRTPIYDVPTVGTTERPVQQGLPTFRADRGGITWVQPPTLPGYEGAVSLWRYDGSAWVAYTDPEGTVEADPNDEKPCLKVECGNEQSVDVDAVPFCLTFDNLTARAFPEWVRATTELTMVAQARFAEQKSLAQLFSLAATGSAGTITENLGVARDFFQGVAIAGAAKRHEHRMSESAPLQLLAPRWLATAIAVDLGLGEDFDVHSRNEVDGYFGELNLSPIWYIDDVPGQDAFDSASAFPATANWLLFPTGTYVRLDNGELNLGVVRTKEDVKKNQYTEFSETFETVAHMGPGDYSWTVKGATTVEILGSYSAATSLND